MSTIVEQTVRSTRFRLLIAGSLAAAGVWAFAPYAVNDIATQAAINAPLVRLVAPADGTVGALPQEGMLVDAPTRIELVRVAEDAGTLGEAAARVEQAEALARLMRTQIAAIQAEEGRLALRAARFSSSVTSQIAAQAVSAEADGRSCKVQLEQAKAALARAESLRTTGFVSAAGVEKARAEAARAAAECEAAAARRASLAVEGRAARLDIMIGDSANDQPYSAQQRDRLATERRSLEARMLDAEARAATERRRLAEARARAMPTIPAGLFVWNVLASPGSAVTAGVPLIDLVDCRRRFVDVALPERKAESVHAGDVARVRLVGTDEWVEGRVLRVTGSAAKASDMLFAARPQAREDSREISVHVALPQVHDGTAAAPAYRRCEVGRLAEVRFGRALL